MTNEILQISNFALEQGGKLDTLKLAYTTYGEINTDQSNVIWVFHALTANSRVLEWWPGLFGEGCLYDPTKHFIVCANILCSPYGSSRPEDLSFPMVSVRDTVNAQLALAADLGISKIHTVIGGSCGGSQLLEFAYGFSGVISHGVTIASAPKESAWLIAVHEAQRMALTADPDFGTLKSSNTQGLMAARAIGMVTYRTPESIIQKQVETEEKFDDFKAASYMRYQGESVLREINFPTLVIAITTDLLVPAFTQSEMVDYLPHGVYTEIDSLYGHDGFLLEVEKITNEIQSFYKRD